MYLNPGSSFSHIKETLYFFWSVSKNKRRDYVSEEEMDTIRASVP